MNRVVRALIPPVMLIAHVTGCSPARSGIPIEVDRPVPVVGLGTLADTRPVVRAWQLEWASPPENPVVPGELLVGLTEASDLPAALRGFEVQRLPGTRLALVKGADATLQDLGGRLLADPEVRWVTRHRIATPASDPYYEGDPLTPYNPALRRMRVQEALFEIGARGRSWYNSCVAIIDSGIEPLHPELVGSVLRGYQTSEFLDANTPPASADFDVLPTRHGTRVAGIITARAFNNTGAAGIAPECYVLPLMAASAVNGQMSSFSILRAMWLAAWYNRPDAPFDWLKNQGDGTPVHVVSMSLGFTGVHARMPAFDEMVGLLRSQGILTVVSTGNQGGAVTAPATSPGVVAVGATVATPGTEALAPYSNHGADLDLVAPGSGIWTTDGADTSGGILNYNESYARFAGTSAAAPMVAALAALIRGRYAPELDVHPAPADWIEARLRASAVDLGEPGWDPYFGWGRPDALQAVSGDFVP